MAIVTLCGCFDNHSRPTPEEFSAQANCTIAQLQSLCNNGYYNITSDMVCVGRVTTSDHEGNFYRSMFVEDNTASIEVKLGSYNIEAQYPVGLLVAIQLNGTAISLSNHVLQLGLPPQSYDSTPRDFEAQEIIDHHITRSNSIEAITPLQCDIALLNTSLCGRFVRIEGLRHSPLPDKEERDYYRFTDNSSNEVYIYISSFANFNECDIPSSTTTIQGILYHEKVGLGESRQYVIKPRFKDDFAILSDSI